MAGEPLNLILGAQVREFLAGVQKAATAAESLRLATLQLQQVVDGAFKSMEAVVRGTASGIAAGIGKAGAEVQSFGQIAKAATQQVDAAFKEMERDVDASMSRVVRSTEKASGGIAGIGGAAKRAGGGLRGAFGALETQVSGTVQRVSAGIFNLRNAFLGLGGVAVGREVVGFASDFNKELGQLAIVANDTGVPIEDFRKRLLALSQTTSKDVIDLTRSLAGIIGTLPKGTNQAALGWEILEAAQNAARISGAETEEVYKGVTAVLNVYGKDAGTAADVTEKLFATFDQGGATVPQLTAAIGDVAGIAATYNISIDELLGSTAVLTRAGQTASTAFTNIRQALITLAKPTKEAQEEAAKYGITLGAAELRTKGLIGTLEELQAAGAVPVLGKILTDVQGFSAASALIKSGLGQTRKDIEGVGKAAGGIERGLDIIKNQFDELAGIARNQLNVVLAEAGEKVLPKLAAALKEVGDFLIKNKEAIAEGFSDLVDVLLSLGRFVASNAGTILAFFAAFKVQGLFSAVAREASGLATALTSVATAAAGGASAGATFVSGFTSKLGSIVGFLGQVLRGAGIAGVVLVAAYELGDAIGNAIGRKMTEGIDAAAAESAAEIERLAAVIEARFKKLGFKTQKEGEDRAAAFNRGELVDVGGKGLAADLLSPKDVIALKGAEAANEAFTARLAALQKTQQGLAKDAKDATERAGATQALLVTGRRAGAADDLARFKADAVSAVARLKELNAASANLRNLIGVAATEARAKAGADAATTGPVQGPVDQRTPDDLLAQAKDRAQAAKAGAKSAEQAAKRAAQLQQDLSRLRSDIASTDIRTEQARADALIDQTDRITEAAVESARAIGATDVEITAARQAGFEHVEGIIRQQIDLVRRERDAEIQAAEEAAAFQIQEAEGSAEKRALIERQLAGDVERIKFESSKRVTAFEVDESDRRAKLTEAMLADVLRKFEDGLDDAQAAGPAAQGPGFFAQLRKDMDEAVQASLLIEVFSSIANVGQTIKGAADGLVNTINLLAAFLRSGIADFIEELAGAIGGLLVALVEGLPDQVERIFGEVIPKLIEALIGGAPAFVGALIALAPRIVAGVVKGIPEIIKSFGRGFLEFGKQIADFFTSDIVQAIGKGVGDFFADIGRAIWSALPGWGREFIVEVGRGIAKIIKDLLDLGGDAASALIGGGDPLAIGGVTSEAGRARVAAAQQRRRDIPASSRPEGQESVRALIAEFIAALKAEGLAYTDVRFVAGQLGLDEDVVRRVLGLSEGQGGTGIGREDRIQIRHQGGPVRGPGVPDLAAALANVGAQRFSLGGMVQQIGREVSARYGGDNVPILAQAGEGILSRLGMRAAGGEGGLDAMNRGQAGGSPVVEIRFEARNDADRHIMGLAVGRVSASVRDPLGRVRQALDQTARPGPPLGTSYVKR